MRKYNSKFKHVFWNWFMTWPIHWLRTWLDFWRNISAERGSRTEMKINDNPRVPYQVNRGSAELFGLCMATIIWCRYRFVSSIIPFLMFWIFWFNFFFIRSSVMTINNFLLNEKYNNVNKSIREMMHPMKSMRPTCEQLLNNKSL